jgi:hypothetical protein
MWKTKNPSIWMSFWFFMVQPTGLEPVTSSFAGRRSNPTELRLQNGILDCWNFGILDDGILWIFLENQQKIIFSQKFIFKYWNIISINLVVRGIFGK